MDQHPHTDERIPAHRRGFHAKDGFFFRRNEDGSVTVRLEQPPWGEGRGELVKEIVLERSAWASVTASVSARGENAESHDAALALHG